MNKLTIPYKGRVHTYLFAEEWAEVPARMLPWLGKNIWPMVSLYRHLLQQIEDKDYLKSLTTDTRLQVYRIELLTQLCNIGKWPFSSRNRAFYSLMADEVADVLSTTNFLLKSIDAKRPFKSFRWRFTRYYGPEELLNNITAGEFHFAEKAFVGAMQEDKEALAMLCAILYRPKGKTGAHTPGHADFKGDVRLPFNRHEVEERAKRFTKLPGKYAYPVLLWFAGQRAAIINNYPEVFSGSGDGGSADGWLDVFRALAKNPLHFNEVTNMPLSFLLWELAKLDQDRRREELRRLNATSK